MGAFHYIPILCFALKEKKQKKILFTFWQVPQGLEMKGSMQVQSFITIYIAYFFPLLSQEYVLVSETSCIERIFDCF